MRCHPVLLAVLSCAALTAQTPPDLKYRWRVRRGSEHASRRGMNDQMFPGVSVSPGGISEAERPDHLETVVWRCTFVEAITR